MGVLIDKALEEACTKVMDISDVFPDDTPLVTKAILVFEVGMIEGGEADTYLAHYRTSSCAVWDLRGMLGDAIENLSPGDDDD